MKPDETHLLVKCQDIKKNDSHNILLLNSDETEIIVPGPEHIRNSLSKNLVNVDVIALAAL